MPVEAPTLASRRRTSGGSSGRRVLVTGAAGVLGQALVVEADHRGAAVVAAGRSPRIDDADLPQAAHRLSADLRDPAACRRLVHDAARLLGGLDIVVNNAATLVRKEFRELSLDELDAAWEVNLRAPALIMQESFEYLERGTSPAIVNVVSTAGVSGGVATVSAYGMSKAGLIVLTKAVAREYGPFGIRVFALSPPSLDSEMQRSLPEAYREQGQGDERPRPPAPTRGRRSVHAAHRERPRGAGDGHDGRPDRDRVLMAEPGRLVRRGRPAHDQPATRQAACSDGGDRPARTGVTGVRALSPGESCLTSGRGWSILQPIPESIPPTQQLSTAPAVVVLDGVLSRHTYQSRPHDRSAHSEEKGG